MYSYAVAATPDSADTEHTTPKVLLDYIGVYGAELKLLDPGTAKDRFMPNLSKSLTSVCACVWDFRFYFGLCVTKVCYFTPVSFS